MKSATVDVSLLTTGHDVADARLHRLVSALLSQGLSVEIDGLGTAGDAPPGAFARTRPRRSLGHRAIRALRLPWTARGRVLLVLDPDLALSALPRRLAAWRSRNPSRTGSRLIVDVHEDYQKTLLDRSWAKGLRLVAARVVVAGAMFAATRADLTIVADDHLPPRQSRRRLVVRNLPLLEMLPAPSAPDLQPRALYVGDVRCSRGLRNMLALVEANPEWALDVVGPVAAADRGWLAHWRTTSSASSRVTFHGRRPPREAWRLASGAWVGLCLLEPTPAFVAALPSKIYEYLACGLAVLTTPLPRAATLVTEAGAGAVVADVGDASAALRHWAIDPGAVGAHQAAARSWSNQTLSDADPYGEFARRVAMLANGTAGVGR